MTDTAVREENISSGYRWFALLTLTLIYVVNYIDRQIMAILVEPIKAEFVLTDTQMGLLTGFVFAMF